MKESSAKKNILKKIRQALATPVPVPFSENTPAQIFKTPQQDFEIEFAEKFTALQGKFSFCFSTAELINQLETLFTARDFNFSGFKH